MTKNELRAVSILLGLGYTIKGPDKSETVAASPSPQPQTMAERVDAAQAQAVPVQAAPVGRKCGVCGGTGHNSRTCSQRPAANPPVQQAPPVAPVADDFGFDLGSLQAAPPVAPVAPVEDVSSEIDSFFDDLPA